MIKAQPQRTLTTNPTTCMDGVTNCPACDICSICVLLAFLSASSIAAAKITSSYY